MASYAIVVLLISRSLPVVVRFPQAVRSSHPRSSQLRRSCTAVRLRRALSATRRRVVRAVLTSRQVHAQAVTRSRSSRSSSEATRIKIQDRLGDPEYAAIAVYRPSSGDAPRTGGSVGHTCRPSRGDAGQRLGGARSDELPVSDACSSSIVGLTRLASGTGAPACVGVGLLRSVGSRLGNHDRTGL
jgi:hypothetical protein